MAERSQGLMEYLRIHPITSRSFMQYTETTVYVWGASGTEFIKCEQLLRERTREWTEQCRLTQV